VDEGRKRVVLIAASVVAPGSAGDRQVEHAVPVKVADADRARQALIL